MSGDLEDFLRRAAERRKAKAAQQQKQQQPVRKRPSPQYSDRRTERVPRVPDVEEIPTAEIVEAAPLSSHSVRMPQTHQTHTHQTHTHQTEAQTAAVHAKQSALAKSPRGSSGPAKASTGSMAVTGDVATDLIRLLHQPGGIQQAILLREIFDRPEHRW